MRLAVLFVLLSCASPPTGPSNFTEHQCKGGSYCPNDWDCGGDVPSCPSQLCCDQEPTTDHWGLRRSQWKRIP